MGFNQTSFKKGHLSLKVVKNKIERTCLTCSTKFSVWKNVVEKGQGKYCSGKCRGRAVGNLFSTLKLGSNNPQWRGGVTVGRLKLINTLEYKTWRRSVFERDNYTCVQCGIRGGVLNADHIVPWWKDEAKRFDIKNGQTLCATCHLIKTKGEMKENWVNQYSSGRKLEL